MAKKIPSKTNTMDIKSPVIENQPNSFYFGKHHFKWMLIGLVFLLLGFILMMGSGANTRPDGSFDPHYFNEDIFSFVRIRLAPSLIIIGFVIQVFAILKKK